jgi:hypothetical protein
MAAVHTKNATKPMKVTPSIMLEAGLSASARPAKIPTPTSPSQPIHRGTADVFRTATREHGHDHAPEDDVPGVVHNQGEDRKGVGHSRQRTFRRRVAGGVSGHELVRHRDRNEVRECDQGKTDRAQDRRKNEPGPDLPERVVEADQRRNSEKASEDDQPGSEEKRPARLATTCGSRCPPSTGYTPVPAR